MKKLSILFAALLTCSMSFAADYAKVTSAPTDWSGKYILVYENSTTKAYVWTGVDAANCYTSATIANNKISGDNFVTITISSMEGGYSIMVNGGDNDGKYLGGKTKNSSADNGCTFSTTTLVNTLNIEDASVKITSDVGSYMRFNKTSNQMRFRYFKSASASSQQAVQLYKLVPVAATGITLDQSTLTLDKGATAQLTATLTPADATTEVVWASSNEAAVTVDNGKVTAVGEGTAIITATAGEGVSATCNVTVTAATPVESVTLDQTTLNIEATKSATLVATVLPADATNKNVTWTTSDAAVAIVKDGVVTGVAAGTADITATTEDGAKTAVCQVVVSKLNGMDYSVNLGTDAGYNTWTVSNKSIGSLSSVWTLTSGYAKATAYNSGNNAAEAWLVSPVLDLSAAEVAAMTINHALNYLNGKECPLKIMGTNDGENWVELSISEWPAGSSWTFEEATVDLTSVISANTQVALAYISTTSVTPTWEVKTVTIKGTEAVHATAINLDKTELTLEQYKRSTLTATLTPTDATDAITWETDKADVVTVSATGEIVAVGMGTANITAKVTPAEGTVYTATCAVTITAATPITVAEAVEVAKTVSTNNELAAGGQYVIRGYAVSVDTTDYYKYKNYTVGMADDADGSVAFKAYRVIPVDGTTIAAVGDYIEVIGDITKYGTTYETAQGGSIEVITKKTPTSTENAEETISIQKVLRDGQVLLIRDGKAYNVMGQRVD